MGQQRMRWWAGALVGALLATACGGEDAADKTGGDTVVLHMATIDGDVNGNGQLYGPVAFVEALEEVSDGQIKVEVETGFGEGAADAESRIVEAIAAGDLDGGWPSTRAFAEAGIDGLEAVEAPMTINSYAVQGALATAPVAEELLDQLEGSGVVGVGLTVGPLRRPFAAEAALLAPEDWSGTTFRSYNSPVQAAAIEALGGAAVNLGTDWADAVAAGELDGAEFDVAQYAEIGLGEEVPFVTGNVVLWPKMFVLSLSQERFDALTDEQRGFVEEAARMAVEASVDGDYDDSSLAEGLCEGGVRFFDADSEQLDALYQAVAPVVDALAADPATASVLEAIQAIAAELPDVDAIEVPDSCRSAVPGGEAALVEQPSTLPDGIYRVEISVEEVADHGVSNGAGFTGTWTFTIEDGIFELRCIPLDLPGKDCGNAGPDAPEVLEAGYVRGGDGPVVYFVGDGEVMAERSGCRLPPSSTDPEHCFVLEPYSFDWSLDGDQLTLSNPVGGGDGFAIEPLTKIS